MYAAPFLLESGAEAALLAFLAARFGAALDFDCASCLAHGWCVIATCMHASLILSFCAGGYDSGSDDEGSDQPSSPASDEQRHSPLVNETMSAAALGHPSGTAEVL